jgi:hypothetical protein
MQVPRQAYVREDRDFRTGEQQHSSDCSRPRLLASGPSGKVHVDGVEA